jgi:plastocyanin
MCTRRLRHLTLLAAAALAAAPSAGNQTGEVRGHVTLAFPELQLASLGPIAIYLEALDARSDSRPRTRTRISQVDAAFAPGFSIAVAGDEVELANDDDIFHNVFSFSEKNSFDLGLYPKGEMRAVRLRHAGEVNIYCSIHESMSATILVVPGPHHAQVAADGSFRIRDVAPGRYRLRTWNATLPAIAREIAVRPGPSSPLELRLGGE